MNIAFNYLCCLIIIILENNTAYIIFYFAETKVMLNFQLIIQINIKFTEK